ncbi:hypothetical protein CR513_28615, partial [Mucuna pruriens]
KGKSNFAYPRYKARLVVKGVDFNEIFSPMVKMLSIRIVLSLAVTFDLEVEQMDRKTNSFMEEIYMKQPDVFQISEKEDYAPRQWYKKFELVMCEQGYRKTTSNHCLFIRKFSDDDFIILLLYVDHMLVVRKSISRIDRLKKQLSESFSMKDMGVAKQILGIRIIRDRQAKKLWLSQEHYVKRVLHRFHMKNAKAVNTSLTTHFKMSFGHNPSNEATKTNIAEFMHLQYLHGTSDLRLYFGGDKPTLVEYLDSNMARDIDSKKSTSTCKELIWVKKFLQELGFVKYKYLSKHINVRYYWIRDALDAKLLELSKVHTNDNDVDMMTKALPRGKFEACYEIVGLAITST